MVHVVQRLSFLFGALLVWWSVIEPKRRRTPGELWKVPYLIGARVGGMFLGVALILLRSPAYAAYYGDRPREHGLSPITDQQIAGGMMIGLDLLRDALRPGVLLLPLGRGARPRRAGHRRGRLSRRKHPRLGRVRTDAIRPSRAPPRCGRAPPAGCRGGAGPRGRAARSSGAPAPAAGPAWAGAPRRARPS